MYILYVVDTEVNLLAAVTSYTSLRLKRSLYEKGALELHVDYFAAGAQELQPGRIVFLEPEKPFYVEKVQLEESDNGVEIVAYGGQLKDVLARRVTVPDTTDEELLFGYDRFPAPEDPEVPVETVIKHYANKHAINPIYANRKLPNLYLAEDQARGILTRWSSRFESLASVFKAIGESTDMGFDIRVDKAAGRLVFDVIPSSDRTINSLSPVIFSVNYGNVDSLKYTQDTTNIINASYAGGAGEGEGRLIQTVVPEGEEMQSGFARYESWVDCGNIEEVDRLIIEARHKMKEKILNETFTGDIALSGSFEYGKDYDLGDRVTLQSKRMGITKDAQITAIDEKYSKSGLAVSLTFGKRQLTILDEIRKEEAIR